ncbi:glycosyltransferase [bacterium]|nr:glycosyltransferase [bacterium]
MKPRISIIIPVLSTSVALELRLDEINRWSKEQNLSPEIIVVVDGNQDNKWSWVKQASALNPHIKALYLDQTEGISSCVLCGLRNAQGQFVATIDAESKYRVSDLDTLYQIIEKSNCNLVYGYSTKISPGVMGNLKYRTKANLFALFTGLPAYVSEFRIMEGKLCENLPITNNKHFMADKILCDQQAIYAGIPVKIQQAWFKNKVFGDLIGSNLTFKSILAASNIAEFTGIALLAFNIYLLWHGLIIQSLLIAILTSAALIAVYYSKWISTKSYEIKEKLNFAPEFETQEH